MLLNTRQGILFIGLYNCIHHAPLMPPTLQQINARI